MVFGHSPARLQISDKISQAVVNQQFAGSTVFISIPQLLTLLVLH